MFADLGYERRVNDTADGSLTENVVSQMELVNGTLGMETAATNVTSSVAVTSTVHLTTAMDNDSVSSSSLREDLSTGAFATPFWDATTIMSDESVVYLERENMDQYFYNFDQTVILTIVMPVLLAFGVACNGAFLVVVARNKRMHTPTNCYLVNLAVSDVVYLSVVVSDKLIRYFSSPFPADYSPWGPRGCSLITGLIFIPHFVSELTIAMFTVERFYAICRPLKRHRLSGRRKSLIFVGAIWITSALLAIPCNAFIKKRVFTLVWPESLNSTTDLPKTIMKCGTPPISFSGGATLQCYALQAIPFFFTAGVTVVLNTRIIRTLNRSAKTIGSAGGHRDVQSRRQIVKMLIVTSVMFYALVFPYYIDDILTVFHHFGYLTNVRLPTMFLQVARFLAYTNSAINPIMYSVMSVRYRQAFKSTFCACTKAQRSENSCAHMIRSADHDSAALDQRRIIAKAETRFSEGLINEGMVGESSNSQENSADRKDTPLSTTKGVSVPSIDAKLRNLEVFHDLATL